MGTSSSNPFREGGELMSEFTVTSKNPEAFLTYLTQKRTEKEYVMRQLTYTEQRQYTIHCQKAKNRKIIKNKHVTHLQRIEQRSQDNMCSNFFKMYTLWEYSSRSLFDEIKQRALQRKPFENVELWSILAGSIMGLAAFQEKDVRHECLTTKAIVMESDGNVKIVDPMAVGLLTNFESIFNNRTLKNIYLSPQQCQAIESQKPIINKNAFKNDVFTMAMILLQCGLLQRQDQCYLDDCSRINWSKIQANINRFGQIYQQSLKEMLVVMLSKDIRSRPDWLDLDGFVKKNSTTTSKMLNYDQPTERRTQFIRRTVQNSLPNKNKNTQNNANSTPMQNEPTYSKFYGQAPPQHSQQNGNPLTSYSEVKQVLYSSPRENLINKVNQPNFNSFSNNQPYSTFSKPDPFAKNQGFNFKPFETVQVPNSQITFKPAQTGTYDPYSLQKLQSNLPKPGPSINNYYSANPTQYQYFSVPQKEVVPFQLQKNYVSNSIFYPPPQINSIESKQIKQSDYASRVELPNKVTDINSFSPINFSQYVRPAHSVDYEVIKAQSPNQLKQEGKVQASTVPFDPKITSSPESKAIQQSSQLQYVVEHFKTGSRYQGYKLNGQRHGKGKFYYQDGGRYDGQWKNNKMEGFGTLYYQNDGKAYEGMWVNDQFQGKGKLFNENPLQFNQFYDFNSFDDIQQYWQYYQGDFTGDEKDGKGRLKFSNGQLFEGTFKRDMVQGEGTFFCLDGRRIHGVWSENRLVSLLQ